jgi:hypothetical protein
MESPPALGKWPNEFSCTCPSRSICTLQALLSRQTHKMPMLRRRLSHVLTKATYSPQTKRVRQRYSACMSKKTPKTCTLSSPLVRANLNSHVFFLLRHFNQSKLTSLQRQLNLRFSRITQQGLIAAATTTPAPAARLCRSIDRQRVKGNGTRRGNACVWAWRTRWRLVLDTDPRLSSRVPAVVVIAHRAAFAKAPRRDR